MISTKFDMVTILGPTASGKTEVAVNLAYKIDGEIISADSRQVYREMKLERIWTFIILMGMQFHIISLISSMLVINTTSSNTSVIF